MGTKKGHNYMKPGTSVFHIQLSQGKTKKHKGAGRVVSVMPLQSSKWKASETFLWLMSEIKKHDGAHMWKVAYSMLKAFKIHWEWVHTKWMLEVQHNNKGLDFFFFYRKRWRSVRTSKNIKQVLCTTAEKEKKTACPHSAVMLSVSLCVYLQQHVDLCWFSSGVDRLFCFWATVQTHLCLRCRCVILSVMSDVAL